jgi:uncharacterized protein YceH (UPF0502 family)
VDYDEPTIRAALESLSRRGWVRLASGAGSRAIKYRHLLDEALSLSPGELSLLAVLMLRGPQTPGELRARTERLYRFGVFEELQGALDGLIARELAVRLERRPGQKEERYAHLLGEGAPSAAAPASPPAPASDDRVEALEARVDRLEDELEALRRTLDTARGH